MNEPGSLQENLTAVRAGRRPAVVWGAGQTFLAIQPMFDFPIAKLVDGDPRKWGTTVAGLQVEPPAALGSLAKDAPVVFICSLDPGVTEAIAGELARLDIHQRQAADSRSDLLVELAGGWVERAPASVEAHYQLGRACQLAARSAIWARGVQAYEWVVGHDPANGEAWFALATLQSNGGHDGVAADLFRQVLRLAPAHARAHQGLSECLANLGDREGAMYHLREAAMLSQDIAARAVEDLADLAAPPRRKRKAPVARYPTKAELDGDLLAAIRAKLPSAP